MEINVDIVLHSVRADGVGAANALHLFGNGPNQGRVKAGCIGHNFYALEKNLVDCPAQENNDSDR